MLVKNIEVHILIIDIIIAAIGTGNLDLLKFLMKKDLKVYWIIEILQMVIYYH